MSSLKVVDVTLRDGGCVNNFDFGQEYMDKILCNLERSRVDCIELGYLDENSGSEQGRTQFCNEQVINRYFLKEKKQGVTYVVMMDYGKFNVDHLKKRTEDGIDGIRVAFHKKDWKQISEIGRRIMQKGYEFYIQPMITLRYSDRELLDLINMVNRELSDANGFYIVDSFGEMRADDMNRLLSLVNHNLYPGMTIGFHSHNNLQLSYSNAMFFLQFPTKRDRMLDASVMGMGKGAGNLNTELLLEHLNLYADKRYCIAPLLELIDQVINVIHKESYWGYSVEYYLASVNHCTPSYAGHFYNRHMLSIEQVSELLQMISEEKKGSFDKNYAEQLYHKYNADKSYDDTDVVKQLSSILKNRRILLIAPGKSILTSRNKIEEIIQEEDVISISLNHFAFLTDYVVTTRQKAFEEAIERKKNIIVPSNISRDGHENINVIDYQRWVVEGQTTHDSSGTLILNLLWSIGTKNLMLAGFDGFSVDINANYFEKTLRNPVTEAEARERNDFFGKYIRKLKRDMAVDFITPSLYQV